VNTRIAINIEEPEKPSRGLAVLASGHRPFFLAAGLSAASGLALWAASLAGYLSLTSSWHGHEMIFGFAVAAIAGFLMAAVPKWTGGEPIHGLRLLLLVALWLAGRLAMMSGIVPWVDLLFLPLLASFMLADVLRARNTRNYQVPAILFGLAGFNTLYHFGDSVVALHAAAYLITGLIALIGGRIVPAFTQNALRLATRQNVACTTPRWLDRIAVLSIILVIVAEIAAPHSVAGGIAAALAGVVLLVRMAGWHSVRTLGMPIVWILHVGYVFVPVGFLLKAAADLGHWFSQSAALHALTAGAIGVMVLAVASRAALGHAGRPLIVSRWTVLAYLLVITGALVRMFAPYPDAMVLAGILWSLGYAVFTVVYWPILTRRRSDGLPG
jgi:uncharacterized protein involved in response to NO